MTVVRRRGAAIIAAAVLIPSLTGCWAGYGAQTSQQANQAVGNGASMQTGDIEVRGATWVRSSANPLEATLVATFVNSSDVPDTLTKVEIQPVSPMGITGGTLVIPNVGSVRTGHWSTNFINALKMEAFPSAFITTTFTFERAGTVTGDVLSVPDTGQYAGTPVSLLQQQAIVKLATGAQAAAGKKGQRMEAGDAAAPVQQDAGVETQEQAAEDVKEAVADQNS